MKRVWQIANILSLAFALLMNFLVGAQILPLPAIGDISDKYSTLLTPATYAFSIWSLIYLLLIVFVVYQARDIVAPRKENTLPMKLSGWFVLASIANGLWTFVFVQEWILLSVGILLLLTGSLYRVIWKLDIAMHGASIKVIVCVWWPLLIYTGWVTAATVVNIASWLKSENILITSFVACVVLVLFGVAMLVLLAKRNLRELVLAAIWAIVAIGVQQMASSAIVGLTAYVVGAICLLGVLAQGYGNRRHNEFYKKLLG